MHRPAGATTGFPSTHVAMRLASSLRFILGAAISLALLAAEASAQDVCEDAAYKKTSILRSPSSNYDPLHWDVDAWKNYIHTYTLQGVAVTLALLGLIILLQLAFYTWRIGRCVYCLLTRKAPKPLPPSPYLELTNSWFRAQKWISAALGTGAIAFCVAGMVLLPKNIVSEGAGTFSPAIAYGGGLLGQVDGMLASVAGISSNLDLITRDINDAVDIPSLTLNTQCALQLLSAPDPGKLSSDLRSLDAALHSLGQQLQQLLDMAAAVLLLPPALDDIAASPSLLQAMAGGIASYSAALNSLPLQGPGRGSSAVARLAAASRTLQSQLPPWTASLDRLSASLLLLQSARDDELLSSLANTSLTLYASIQPAAPLQHALLAQATQSLQAMGAFLAKSSPAIDCADRLAAALRAINASLVAFPPGAAQDALANVSDAAAAMRLLVSGGPNSSSANTLVVQALSDLGALPDTLRQAPDPAQLASTSSSAAASMWMLPDVGSFVQSLQQIQAALAALGAADTAVSTPLASYLRSGYWADYSQAQLAAPGARDAAQRCAALLGAGRSTALQAGALAAVLQPQLRTLQQLVGSQQSYAASQQATLDSYELNVTTFLDPLDRLQPSWQSLQKMGRSGSGLQSALDWVTKAVRSAQDTVRSAQRQVQQGLRGIGSTGGLHSVYDTALRVEGQYEQQGGKWWGQYAWKGWLGLYALLISLVLLTCAMVLSMCPGGLVLALAACQLYLLLFLLLVLAASAALVTGQDTCWAAEKVVIGQVSDPDISKLLQFYLYQVSSQNLSQVLKQANVLDVSQVQSSLNATLQQVAWFRGNYTLGSTLQPRVGELTRSAGEVQGALEALLGAASHEPVNALYMRVKTFLCCDAASHVFVQWVCMAAAALLVCLMLLVDFVVLGRLDILPRKNCWGFQCYRAAHYKPPTTGLDTLTSSSCATASLHLPPHCTQPGGGMEMHRGAPDTRRPDQVPGPRRGGAGPEAGGAAPSPFCKGAPAPAGPMSFYYFGASPPKRSALRDEAGRNSLPGAGLREAEVWGQVRDTDVRDGTTPRGGLLAGSRSVGLLPGQAVGAGDSSGGSVSGGGGGGEVSWSEPESLLPPPPCSSGGGMLQPQQPEVPSAPPAPADADALHPAPPEAAAGLGAGAGLWYEGQADVANPQH